MFSSIPTHRQVHRSHQLAVKACWGFKSVTEFKQKQFSSFHLWCDRAVIINESTASAAQPAGVYFHMERVKTMLLLVFVQVWEITVTAETQTPLRGLGATSLVQTGRSRDSSAILTHAQVGTSCKKTKTKCVLVENNGVRCLQLSKYSSTQR